MTKPVAVKRPAKINRPEAGSIPEERVKSGRIVQKPRGPSPAAKKPSGPVDMSKVKLQFEYVDINDIKPYEWNARDNAKAVAAVANSIRLFGFVVPVVIDKDGILGAGHTRVEAAKTLGMDEVPAVRAEHLTKEQMDAFRIADNKVAEIATWNTDMLADELGKLSSMFDFTALGFTQGEMDCLASLVGDDCLSTANLGALTGQTADDAPIGQAGRRAPLQARYVLGELSFFTTAEQYRNWMHGLRALHNFDEAAIAEDLKHRLGILE